MAARRPSPPTGARCQTCLRQVFSCDYDGADGGHADGGDDGDGDDVDASALCQYGDGGADVDHLADGGDARIFRLSHRRSP